MLRDLAYALLLIAAAALELAGELWAGLKFLIGDNR